MRAYLSARTDSPFPRAKFNARSSLSFCVPDYASPTSEVAASRWRLPEGARSDQDAATRISPRSDGIAAFPVVCPLKLPTVARVSLIID